MNKINIFVLVAILLIVGGLLVLASPGNLPNTQNSVDNSTLGGYPSSNTNYDFGTISMAKGKVTHAFKIKNVGPSDVEIKRVYTSCMCTLATFRMNDEEWGPFSMQRNKDLNKILSIGQEAEVEATFDPAAHGPAGVGNIKRTVTVETDSGDLIEFNFSAIVTP